MNQITTCREETAAKFDVFGKALVAKYENKKVGLSPLPFNSTATKEALTDFIHSREEALLAAIAEEVASLKTKPSGNTNAADYWNRALNEAISIIRQAMKTGV